MKYILRIITLPFYMVLVLIGLLRAFIKHGFNWIMYGGEAVAYTERSESTTIYDIYRELKDQRKTTEL